MSKRSRLDDYHFAGKPKKKRNKSENALAALRKFVDKWNKDRREAASRRRERERRETIKSERAESAKLAGVSERTLARHPSIAKVNDYRKYKKEQKKLANDLAMEAKAREIDKRNTINQLSKMSGSFDDLADQFGRDEAVEAKVFWKAVSRIRENPEFRESREKFAEELKKRTGASTFMEAYKKILEDNKDLIQSLKTDLLFADYDYEDIKDQINSATIIL